MKVNFKTMIIVMVMLIAVFTVATAQNLALGKSATSSSNESSSLTPDKAVDGNMGTRWSSAFSDPQWIRIDLGTTYSIDHVILYWEAAYGRTYKIQVSLNGSTFTDVFSTSSGNGGTDDIYFTTVSARYVRMYGTQRSTQYGYSLWEFEVYAAGGGPTSTPTAPPTPPPSGLVWSDEFTSSIGSDWVFEIGNGSSGWGNNELEYYRTQNATVSGGNLVITAKKESYGGYSYTSARMKTQGNKDWKYGTIEARMKLPSVQGLWPAFWMLGTSITSVGWPACGEIDIMEHINTENKVYGTIHWDNGGYANYGGSRSATPTSYHVYSIEWDSSSIRWLYDGVQWWEANILNGINGTSEFHAKFFVLLNLAVGGNWPGFTIDDSSLPASMYVDYVRVYQ